MPRRTWTGPLTLLASLAAGCVFGYLQAPPTVHGYQVKPFVLHQVEKMYKEGAYEPVVSSHQVFARRSDGSWSFTHTGREADGSYATVVEYFNSVHDIYVHTEPVTRSVMTRAVPPAEIQRHLEAGFRSCQSLKAGYEAGPHSRMLGYDVILVSETDKAGTESRWVAPALDCYALRSVYRTPDGRHDDFAVGEVQEVEPPAELCEVPSGYVERSPKEIEALYAKRIPGAEVFPRSILERLERKYKAERPAPQ
jgi:hypothetical protein